MQYAKTGKRLLSGLLALGVCLSPAAPAALAEEPAAGDKPVIQFSGNAAAWTPVAGEGAKVWLTAPGMAIDNQANFSLSGDIADQYTLENGVLKLRDGATVTDGTLTVSSEVAYYTADQLLWTDDSETGNSFTPSKAKYALNHSDAKPRNGQKSLTILPVSGADGMWSKEINSTGTLVFYYYDAGNATDPAEVAAMSGGNFDQIKFGVVINNYPDFLLGVGVPANGDKDETGALFRSLADGYAKRTGYADTYTLRLGGNWISTNIPRSAGWHRMEVAVAADGARASIDGAAVCKEGATEQIVATGVTSISKVAIATNWADKAETVAVVQNQHFIDDMYILKPDAGGLTTGTVTLDIHVKAADAAADETAVAEAKAAIEADFADSVTVSQAEAPDQAAARTLALGRIQNLLAGIGDADTTNNVEATIIDEAFTAPVAGTLTSPDGTDGVYKFKVALKRNAAGDATAELTLNITAARYVKKDFALTFGENESSVLQKGETGRVYLENLEDYAVAWVRYTTDTPNVLVSEDGTLTLKPGYSPKAGDTVTVTAEVTCYDPAGVVFVDSFEGEKKFTAGGKEGVYTHSDRGSMFGHHAATAQGSTTGYPYVAIPEVTDVTVTAWYYDANGGADQTKFGFSINGNGGTNGNALGIFYDGVIAPLVNDRTKTHFGARVAGVTYNNYGWGATDAARSTGWHKLEWIVSATVGLTEKIDGKVISTNPYVGSDMTEEQQQLVPIQNNGNVRSLTGLTILNGWSNNAANLAEISHRHFIDGVSVVKTGTTTQTETLTSRAIEIRDVAYTVTPAAFEADTTYPRDQTVSVAPYIEGDTDVAAVKLDGAALDDTRWSAGRGEAPDNAQNYPEALKGYNVTVNAEVFRGLADGGHTLTLVTGAGTELEVPFTAKANDHVATDYYLSNIDGSDSNDGHTADSPWKTFEKLQTVTFGPGDHIYLDAKSTWNGVQFQPKGSGEPGSPIVMTKYNDGGDCALRPILNGDGTVADFTRHSYLAFDAWRAFYPSGTIELFNVEQWEIRGIEVTNYAQDMVKGATGRNGIAVIFDYLESQGITEVPATNAAREQAFYSAGKLEHIVIEDCYVHDVVGYHPINGAQGRGGKMSGGINAYGPYDDLQFNNNIVMYCDVEGIRNDVLAWMGDTRTQFPAYMEKVSISNNYIAGVPGDGVVISSANKPILENNYLTDAGYSYYATSNTNNATGVFWNANHLDSCKAVTEKTGAQAKPMGNRDNPMIMGATNFAGLWFIGTRDAVAQYNEAVNNVWVCSDAEAFDADMFCWGTIFQYNYTYRNNGGFCLFMGTMDEGTVVRYNVSVEDAQSVGISEAWNGLFHYGGKPEAIHNNLFILGDKVATIFGGPNNTAYFYNNIVVAPNGLTGNTSFGGFHINGSNSGTVKNPKLAGEIKNNIFYPAQIIDSVVEGSTVVVADNIVLKDEAELKSVFRDLDAFMAAQPVKALLGRSDFTGTAVNRVDGKGAGVAMSAGDGRKVKTPTGGFDLEQFAGIKLADGSPAIGAGLAVSDMRDYSYKPRNDAANPLTEDFFKNSLGSPAARAAAAPAAVDIGPHQYSAEAQSHVHRFDQQVADARYLKHAASCTGAAEYFYSCVCGEAGAEVFAHGDALEHTCGDWADTGDGANHSRECTACGAVETAAHSWNGGTVTREPTATRAGEKLYACTVCGGTRTETLNPTGAQTPAASTDRSTAPKSEHPEIAQAIKDGTWGKPDPTPAPKTSGTAPQTARQATRVPRTGDNSNPMLWCALFAAALAGFGGVFYLKKRGGKK